MFGSAFFWWGCDCDCNCGGGKTKSTHCLLTKRRGKKLKKEAKKVKNNNGAEYIKQLFLAEAATETKSKMADIVEDINGAEDLEINLEENCKVKDFLVDAIGPTSIPEEVLREEIEANVEEIHIEKEDVVVNEDAEGFIGPKSPPRMTKEEIAAFYNEIMAKFKIDDK